jgi:hypothetical protein
MKQYVVNSLLALSFVAASACLAGTPSLPETQNTLVDLSKYKTFGWDQSESIYIDSKSYGISDELKSYINMQMHARGYESSAKHPHLIIKLKASVNDQVDETQLVSNQQKTVSTASEISDLTLQVFDAKTNVLVFSDTVERINAANARNERLAQDFQDAVNSKLIIGFPQKRRKGGLSLFPTTPSLPSGFKLDVGRIR